MPHSLKRAVVLAGFTCAGFWALLGSPFQPGIGGFLWRGFLINGGKNEVDFACYYSAALAGRWGYPMHNTGQYALLQPNVLRHVWKSEDGPHAKPENVYLYPALLAYSLVPLTFLAYSSAELVWNLACLAAYGCGVYLFIRCVRLSGLRSPLWVPAIVVLALVWPPLLIGIQHGQVVPWIFFLLALCLWGVLANRPYVAGFSLGLAMALKIGPVLYLLYLVMLRRWRIAGISLVTFLVLLCVGPGHNERFFRGVFPHVRLGSTLLSNQCVTGVICRTVTDRRERWITPEGHDEIRGALLAASCIGGIALALVLVGTWTSDRREEAIVTSFALMAITLAVFLPLSRVTEYTYALFGLGLLLKRWFEGSVRAKILLGVPLVFVIWCAVFDLGGKLYGLTRSDWAWWLSVNATFVWGLLLWFLVLADLFLPRKRASTPAPDQHSPSVAGECET